MFVHWLSFIVSEGLLVTKINGRFQKETVSIVSKVEFKRVINKKFECKKLDLVLAGGILKLLNKATGTPTELVTIF